MGFYTDKAISPLPAAPPTAHHLDVRSIEAKHLQDIDAVVHLAALSNDPLGELDPGLTEVINHQASVRLAKLAREAGVRRFVFSSSCSMYGAADTSSPLDERATFNPVSAYARSKVNAEAGIGALASADFSPVFLRNATAYGLSPAMRFDLVVNNLVGWALATGNIRLQSDGSPWRPIVHVEDIGRACIAALEAPRETVHNQAFNTGADHLNLQIIQLAEIVADSVPGCQIRVLAEPGADQRTYKASFEKFASTFPDFRFSWSAEEGAKDLYQTLSELGLTNQQFTSPQFTRLKWLNTLLDAGHLDSTLRWPD